MEFPAQYVEWCSGNDHWLGARFDSGLGLSRYLKTKMTMPQSHYLYPHHGSDESLAILLLSNQSLYPSSDCEATMLQEALATITEPFPETQPSSRRIIGLEILASILLIGVGVFVQLSHKTNLITPTLKLETVENVYQSKINNPSSYGS